MGLRPGQFTGEGLMEYVTKTARVVPEREARAFCVIAPRAIRAPCGGQFASEGLVEYEAMAARAVPWWDTRAFCVMRPRQFASGRLMQWATNAARAGAMQPRQYAGGSLMEYVTKAARAGGMRAMRRAIRG